MRLPAAVLLVAAVAALALTTTQVRSAVRPRLPRGIYFGWASADDSRLQLLGHPCQAPDTARWIAAQLTPSDALALRQVNADVSVPLDSGAMLVDGAPGLAAAASSSRARFGVIGFGCRAGDAGRADIGTAELNGLGAPGSSSPSLTLIARAADPSAPLDVRVLVINGGENAILLEALEYAPGSLATGRVRAAAGSRAQISALETSIAPVPDGVERPAAPSPWDASYLPPADPRGMRWRSADRLGLRLEPGEAALILIDAASLRWTSTRRPVVLYPVVTVVDALRGSRHSIGFAEPVVGMSRSWLDRWGG